MKKKGFILLGLPVLLVIVLGILHMVNQTPNSEGKKADTEYSFKKPTGYSTEIEPYVNFLNTAPINDPVDYVINLFNKYDIVVLCERDHRDITQYELMYKIVSDKRFIEKSGCVFTEIGTQTINDRLNRFLQTNGLKEKEVDRHLISLYRDLPRDAYWEKYNLYDFIKKVYFLNNSLSDDKKVSINCSDMPVDWSNMTKEIYKMDITDRLGSRDKIMADFIIDKYKEIKKSQSPMKKALVIMNYRHAFNKQLGDDVSNTAAYLYEEFPGKVANIMINPLSLLPGTTDNISLAAPIQNGKWDAAFRYNNNINTAFDFRDTPFGKDHFDYFDFIPHEYLYQDMFNGFIFYYPLEKHLIVTGIPGFIDREFLPKFKNRMNIVLGDNRYFTEYDQETYEEYCDACNEKREMFSPNLSKYNKVIEQWLKY